MKAPLSWLHEFIENETQISVDQASEAFTKLGFEVEDVLEIGKGLTGPVVIGKVLEIEELTEFKKPIRYCLVQVGESSEEVNGIVCGASNFAIGDLVVVALPGAVLPGDFQISQRETYGKVSNGMICSLRELGFGEDHSGILVLNDSFSIGVDAVTALGLHDYVLDLSVLPDRGYALSIRGLARELAIHTNNSYRDPINLIPKLDISLNDAVLANVSASDDCTSLHLTTLTNFDPARPTPWEIQRKLVLSGMRSISLAVDVTNFVMLEAGQPLHAFDKANIKGAINIRYASPSETLETLDHQVRTLAPTDLVVADDEKALSLAGIMGGVTSEISNNTTEIVLEAAYFAAERVAETARRHILSSEASRRFERGVDPNIAGLASDLACSLLIKYGSAKIEGRSSVVNPAELKTIELDFNKMNEIAGYDLSTTEIIRVLSAIGCSVHSQKPSIISAPSWRPDLLTTNDLAEEVLRVTGYDLIPTKLPVAPAGKGLTEKQRLLAQLRTYLAATGLSEILNYPFCSLEQMRIFADGAPENLVKIANPLSEQEPYLRNSLLPGLLTAYQRNLGRGNTNISIFEIGSIFIGKPKSVLPKLKLPLNSSSLLDIDSSLPEQPVLLAIFLTGEKETQNPLRTSTNWQWSDSIAIASSILNQFSIEFEIRAGEALGFHPGRTAEIWASNQLVGVAGELHPKIQEEIGSPGRIALAQLNFDLIAQIASKTVSAKEMSNYPVAKEDLAVVVPEGIPVAKLLTSIASLNLKELDSVEVFDIYQGSQIQSGGKSVALALKFRSFDHTLSADEISSLKGKILDILKDQHQAVLRD